MENIGGQGDFPAVALWGWRIGYGVHLLLFFSHCNYSQALIQVQNRTDWVDGSSADLGGQFSASPNIVDILRSG